jgi:hypothetical protein
MHIGNSSTSPEVEMALADTINEEFIYMYIYIWAYVFMYE